MICLIVSIEPLQECLLTTLIFASQQIPSRSLQIINSELENLHQWLLANRLSLNVAKTEFMIIEFRQRLLVYDNQHIRIEIDGKTIKRVNETKSLGLQIDEHLTWSRHFQKDCISY
jgi:hypothetical protein